MIRNRTLVLLPLALAFALPVSAQDTAPEMTPEQKAMMAAHAEAGTPGGPHAFLAKTAGAYDLTIRSWYQPGGEPTVSEGSATRKMILDGRVLVEDVSTQMGGSAYTGTGLHGFDNVSGKYWSTWNDSMSTGLMTSEGRCDDKGTCEFTGTYNDPVTRRPGTMRMTTRWTNANTEIFETYGPGPDGKEMKMMEITYKKRP